MSSLFVIGYLHVAVSRLGLFASTLPVMAPTLLVSALLVLLSSYITLSLTRRFTASLTGLARVADEVASGGLAKPVQVQGSSEIKEIATILNGIVSGLSSYKTRMDVDHQLLSMKVEERHLPAHPTQPGVEPGRQGSDRDQGPVATDGVLRQPDDAAEPAACSPNNLICCCGWRIATTRCWGCCS